MVSISVLWCLAIAPQAVASRGALESQLGEGPVEVKYTGRGQVRLVRGQVGPLRTDVVGLVRERQGPLGLRADEALSVVSDERDALGGRHVRVRRSIQGVPVAFDEVRVHLDAAGQATSLEAELSDLSAFTYRPPSVMLQRAREVATGGYRGKYLDGPATQLVIVGDRLEGVSGAHVAFKVRSIYPAQPGKVPVGEEVYVDAHSGAVLARLPAVFTAGGAPVTVQDRDLGGALVTLNATQYTDGVALQDVATLSASGGQLFTLDGSASNNLYAVKTLGASFGDPMATNVADNVRKAIAFDLATFGWNRWDFTKTPSGLGGVLAGIAHSGTNLANAYFTVVNNNGQTYGSMNYGDGDGNTILNTARCLDISGHEIGHGIVQGTAGLVYHNQSGALNEHFADVFGWMLDPGNDTIGEGCTGPGLQNRPLRDMCNPANVAIPQPADMAHYVSAPDTDQGDHGGVHTNSGIPNHAACLFRNSSDLATVGRVWFQALSRHLGSTSTFQDMVDATGTSCTELALGASTCGALADAWAAVGLATTGGGGGTSCPPNSTANGTQCFCDTGYHVNAAGTGCDPDSSTVCTAHAHAVGTDCYCDTGYAPDASGSSCVSTSSSASCGANSHREGTSCVCDSCYQFAASPNGEGQVCVAVAGCAVCADPLQTPSSGACVCETGTTPSGATCVGVPGDCGNENYAGRCDGSVLVYCDDTQVSQGTPKVIRTIDCSQNGTKNQCGLSPTIGSYDCVAPCGTVPATGVCVGNTGEICDLGVLASYDCGANGCGNYTYQGVQVQFCNLCPPNATASLDSSGTVSCACNPGYQEDSSHTRCVATGASCPNHASLGAAGTCVCDSGYRADASGSACVAAGGCGATGGPPLVLAGLLVLAFLGRRPRSAS
jgi:bacillolysin